MRAGDFGRNVEAQTQSFPVRAYAASKEGLIEFLQCFGRNGLSRHWKPRVQNYHLRSSHRPSPFRLARHAPAHCSEGWREAGRGALCPPAIGSVKANEASILACGCAARTSAITCSNAACRFASSLSSKSRPPPKRARAKSTTLSIRPRIRSTLPWMSPNTRRDFSSVTLRSRMLAPESIAATGLLRSWPSTAMNCSRRSAIVRSLLEVRLRASQVVRPRRAAQR